MVQVNNRKESRIQFLDTARELETFTIKKCIKFPKRYAKTLTERIVNLSCEIYEDVTKANSVFLDSEEAFAVREKYITRAERNLKCFSAQLSVAKEIIDNIQKTDLMDGDKTNICSSNSWVFWNKLVIDEMRLLSNLRKSDKDRKMELIKQLN